MAIWKILGPPPPRLVRLCKRQIKVSNEQSLEGAMYINLDGKILGGGGGGPKSMFFANFSKYWWFQTKQLILKAFTIHKTL